MLNFLMANWGNALVILIAIIIVIVMLKRGSIVMLKQTLLYLVIKAEKDYGSGTGELKYAAVVSWLYDKLPSILKFFLTAKQIGNLIEDAVTRMKKLLSENEKVQKLIN